MSEEESKNESKPDQIEVLLRKHIKHKTLTEDAFHYMAALIAEDSPANAAELHGLICDFMTDGMVYTEDQSYRVCEVLSKMFLDKQLVSIAERDTIVAEKLSAPIVMADIKIGAVNNVVKDEDFLDPFVAMRVGETSFNKEFGEKTIGQVLKARKDRSHAPDALDKKIEEFMSFKKAIPAPEVRHEKGDNFKLDIMVNNVTLVVGGKTLLDNATLKLVKGKKYGLVGRNGIGKTSLINAISRGEIEKFPMDIHILEVEQEVVGDDKSVLDHILDCDVERKSLLEELAHFQDGEEGEEDMNADEKAKRTLRLAAISERLEMIDHTEAEPKAIGILTGIGFAQEELHKKSKEFSGGWRMRIAIAKVIYSEPEILMLDEPTNHLDLNALIWLEEYIRMLDITIIIVSHARDFLNATVDEIIYF